MSVAVSNHPGGGPAIWLIIAIIIAVLIVGYFAGYVFVTFLYRARDKTRLEERQTDKMFRPDLTFVFHAWADNFRIMLKSLPTRISKSNIGYLLFALTIVLAAVTFSFYIGTSAGNRLTSTIIIADLAGGGTFISGIAAALALWSGRRINKQRHETAAERAAERAAQEEMERKRIEEQQQAIIKLHDDQLGMMRYQAYLDMVKQQQEIFMEVFQEIYEHTKKPFSDDDINALAGLARALNIEIQEPPDLF